MRIFVYSQANNGLGSRINKVKPSQRSIIDN